ncbi:MAG: hmc operon protein 4 [Deltaproteobacteria bacterium]|nr:MAG: hmc operon protein 4 [Deltaproteobacteria bacterium]
MFYTLQDFTAHAKEWGYLLAGLILVSYIPFWIFLNRRATRGKK